MNVSTAARAACRLASVILVGACSGSDREDTRAALVQARVDAGPRACRDNTTCGADELCVYQPGLCGRGRASGSCRRRRAVCEHDGPVCGCDGDVHDDACAARVAGVDLDVTGRCTRPVAARAACGAQFCDPRTSYCELYLSDVFELPGRRRCRPLPATCRAVDAATRSCDCFPKDTPCLAFCGPLVSGPAPDGGATPPTLHLTCQGIHEPRD